MVLRHLIRVVGGAGQVVQRAQVRVHADRLEPQQHLHLGGRLHGGRLQPGRRLVLARWPGAWRLLERVPRRPVGFAVLRHGVHVTRPRAPEADAGVGPPFTDMGRRVSMSSPTGAGSIGEAVTPAACAGVVWHLEHTMSGTCPQRRSTGGSDGLARPGVAGGALSSSLPSSSSGLFSHGGSFFGFFLAFLTGLGPGPWSRPG